MNFCLVNSSKAEFWNFCNSFIFTNLVDELHENPFADAIILPVEFGVLLRLELQGVRDEELSHRIQR